MKNLFILFSLLSFFSIVLSLPFDSNTDTHTFTDEKAGYALQYPSFWECADHTNKNHMIRADIFHQDVVGFQIRSYTPQPSDFRNFTDQYVATFISEMKSHWQGEIKETKREKKVINGISSYWIWIKAEKGNGETWLFKEYLFFLPSGVIALQSGVLQIYREQYEYLLDEVASSFTKK